jgi:HEAT repeat protein/predicted phosphodiesterase
MLYSPPMANTPASPTPQLFQHLPAPVREALLGPGEEGRGGVVAALLEGMLLHFGRSARVPFTAPERRLAVQRALAQGLGASLQRWHPSTPEPVELEKLRAWMREHAVTGHLRLLLRRAPESQLDVRSLSEEMAASEFSVEELGQRDGEAWLRLFVAGFYEGVAREQGLHEVVDLPSLRQLAERLGAVLPPPGEAEGVTAQLEYLQGLAQRLYQGEDLRGPLLEYVHKLLSASGASSPVQQQATYQVVQEALGRAGLATDGEEEILRLQEQLRQQLAARQAGPSAADLEAMEAHYRKTVRDLFERLAFQGISPSGRPLSLPLEDVYVHLNVMVEVAEYADTHSAAERRLLYEAEERGGLDDERGRHLDALRYQRWKQEGRKEQRHVQRRFIESTIFEAARTGLVLLGDPGSGKTTLLRYLALRAARTGLPTGGAEQGRWLPVFVPLAAYDDYLRRVGDAKLEEFLAIYHDRWRNLPGLDPLFHRALEEGRALVLLDGLDEVLKVVTRQYVAQQVWGLIQRWGDRGNRFVLSSRVIGYREVRLPGDLPHFTVLDFGREESRQFARKWCEAFEVWEAGKSTPAALQRARQEEQKLLADVESNPSLTHLAANPLLLTMLALLRRQVVRLPDRRIELYERYVRLLLDNREVSRSEGARQEGVERFDSIAALQHLTDLAMWLHENRPSGTARQQDLVRAMTTMALRRQGKLETATAKEREEAEREAKRCFLDVRDIAGLIAERGQDAYGFLHLTFQEYFVGRALARENADERWRRIAPHLHDPRWRESILLCAGQLGVQEQRGEEVDDLVRRILGACSEHEEMLHRDLFLATAVIADDVASSLRLKDDMVERLGRLWNAPVPSVRSQALDGLAQMVRLGHAGARERFIEWISGDERPWEAINALRRIDVVKSFEDLKRVLLQRLEDEGWRVRQVVADALGAAAVSDAVMRGELLSRLEGRDSDVRQAVAEALGAVAESDAEVRKVLLRWLEDGDWHVRRAAAHALRGVAGIDAKVRGALLQRLEDRDSDVRQAAALALGEAVWSDVMLRKELLRRLEGGDWHVRQATAQALGGAAGSHPEVREGLLQRLKDEDWHVRQATAQALGGAAGSHAEVREGLLQRLKDEDWHVRQATAQALGGAAGSHAEAREGLLQTLEDEDSEVRQAAAQALGGAAGVSEAVCKALLRRLKSGDSKVRQAATQVLGGAAGDDAEAREGFLQWLEDGDWHMRQMTTEALGGAEGSDAVMCEELLWKMENGDWRVRQAAADTLRGAAGGNVAVRKALLLRLRNRDSWVRRAAAQALGGAAGNYTEVREALVQGLKDRDSGVRQAAAQALGGAAGNYTEVREALVRLLKHNDYMVRVAAVRGLVSTKEVVVSMTPLLLEWLCAVSSISSEEVTRLRRDIARALATHIGPTEHVMARLAVMLRHPEWPTREGAAMTLVAMPSGVPDYLRPILLALLDDLRNEADWSGRLEIAESLLNVSGRKVCEEALECVMRAIDYGVLPWYDPAHSAPIRWQAATTLGRLEPAYCNEQVLKRLLTRLQEDEFESVRDAAYHAILRLLATYTKTTEAPSFKSSGAREKMRTISILHLSDLHFSTPEQPEIWYSQLAEDLRQELKLERLDGVILSGDITNVSSQEEYDAARVFFDKLLKEFGVSPQRVVMVPGNHDLCWEESKKAYQPRRLEPNEKPPKEGTYFEVRPGYIDAYDEGKRKQRFERFALFHEKLTGRDYPLDYEEQGLLYHFPDSNLLVLGLNSAWDLDHHFRSRASIEPRMLSRALDRIREEASKYSSCLKVAVWHHPLNGPGEDRIKEHGFLDRLASAGFRLVLHGHIHQAENGLFRYDRSAGGRRLEVVSAGTFGAPVHELVPGHPLQYNLLRFEGSQLTVETRCRERPGGAWRPDARWPQGTGKDPKPRYTLDLGES